MGQYKVVWQQLKDKGKVVLASPRTHHNKIIRALKKEKYKDLAFKFQLSESNRRAIFTSDSEGNKITFYLRMEELKLQLDEI